MPKPIPIQHPCPKEPRTRLFLAPYGLYLNRDLQKANPGDTILFCQEWRKDKATLIRKCKIPVNSSAFTFMAKSIYGEYTRIKDLLAKWEAMAVLEGVGKDGFDRENALLIECRLEEE